MRHVVFTTDGHIDIRSFTVMGLSSKPNSDSPIGKFGTGLKMAIAVLVRNDIKVVLWIGRTKYTFKKYAIKYRGLDTTQIKMQKEVHGVRKILSKTYELLPFTTELGKYWELWQAYRELESNTRDEKGSTMLVCDTDSDARNWLEGISNETAIIVSGEKFVTEYLDREKTFLPDGLTQRGESNDTIQILERPSQHVYWRGIRVHDLPKDTPSQLTYNFLEDIELTEDRTAKDTWLLEHRIKQVILRSEDEGVIKAAVMAPKGSYEETFNYDYQAITPSPTFTSAASASGATVSAARYAKTHLPKPPKIDPWKEFPRPWSIDDDGLTIYDVNNDVVCEAKSEMIATTILSKVNETEKVEY